jgi:hypothetical protein
MDEFGPLKPATRSKQAMGSGSGRQGAHRRSGSRRRLEVIGDAAVEIVDGAGHFIWLDQRGTVVSAADGLLRRIDKTA